MQSHLHEPRVNSRLLEIDGIRGWASLNVLLFHMLNEMFSQVFPVFGSSLLSPLLDGHLPVFVFFVLSGDALSSNYFKSFDERAADRMLVKRYFRLTVPVFISCLVVFAVVRLGADFHAQAAPILHREC